MELSAKLLSDQTGAAFVEALIVLPLLGLILAGVLSFNAFYGAKLEAKARARRIAWLQADSGECKAQPCSSGACRAIQTEIEVDGLGAIGSSQANGYSLASFVGSLRDFFIGKTTTGIGTASAPTPPLVTAGQTWQRGATTLLCNTTPRRASGGESILEHACSTELNQTEYAREVCR